MKVKNLLSLMRKTDHVCVMSYEPLAGSAAKMTGFERGSVSSVTAALTKSKSNPEVISIQCQGSEFIVHVTDHKSELMDITDGIGIFV